MSRRSSSGEGCLFVGRLSKSCRVRDLEDVFEPYGRMSRCEIKYGELFKNTRSLHGAIGGWGNNFVKVHSASYCIVT